MFCLLRSCRRLGWLVAVVISLQAVPAGVAQAGMVATDSVVATEQVDGRSIVRAYLARSEVRDALYRQGVDPQEAMQRVAVLSDSEIAMISGRIEDEPAGQALGIVIAAALIALIVILVADLSGKKDVF